MSFRTSGVNGPFTTLPSPSIPTPTPLQEPTALPLLGLQGGWEEQDPGGNVTSRPHPTPSEVLARGKRTQPGRRRGQGQVRQRLAKKILDKGRSVWEGTVNPAEGAVKGDGLTALEPRLRSAQAALAGAACSSPAAVCLGTAVFCYQGTFCLKSLRFGYFPLPVQSHSFPGVAQVRSVGGSVPGTWGMPLT